MSRRTSAYEHLETPQHFEISCQEEPRRPSSPIFQKLKELKFQGDFLTPELILEHPAHASPPGRSRPWPLVSTAHHLFCRPPLGLTQPFNITNLRMDFSIPILQAEVICLREVYNFQRVYKCPTFWEGGTLHKSSQIVHRIVFTILCDFYHFLTEANDFNRFLKEYY